MKKAIIAALSALVFSFSLPAFAADLPKLIRFGDVGFGFGTPFGVGLQAIADAKGFVAEEFSGTDVKLEWTYLTGTGPAVNEAFANQQVDFASYGGIPAIVGKAGGLSTVLLEIHGGGSVFAVARLGTGIEKVGDLKGKKIAVQKATGIHFVVIEALRAAGVNESDVVIVDLKNADQLAAITAGHVDAVFGGDFLLPLEDKGIAKVIFNIADSDIESYGAFFVTESFRDAYPEATQRVARGIVKASAWLADDKNREEAFQIWSRAGTPVENLRRAAEGADFAKRYDVRLTEQVKKGFRALIDFNKKQGLIRNDVDFDSWVDPRFVQTAINELGYDPERRQK